MDRNDNKEFLANFSSSYKGMIATSETAYGSKYSSSIYTRRYYKRYTPEEIEQIIESGSLASQIQLSHYHVGL